MKSFFKKLGMLMYVVLCVLLILACYGTRINHGQFWYMGLFSLSCVYILMGVVVFMFIFLFIRWTTIFPGIISLAICFNPLQHVIPFRYTPGFSKQKEKNSLRVMSWNVEHFNILHHQDRPDVKQKMIDLINEYQPDVACFQEMVAGDSAKGRINYVGEFQKKLGMKYFYYNYKTMFDFDNLHHFGIIIFSRYPIITQKSFDYRPYNYNSSFQYVDIKKGKDTIRVFNVHFQSLRLTPQNKKYIDDPTNAGADNLEESKNILQKFKTGYNKRIGQVQRVKAALAEGTYPTILCGDFNDVPNSYAYNTIGAGMKNAFRESGYGIGATFSEIAPTLRIDNIFCDPAFDVLQFTRIPKKLSDHYPIITDLLLKK